MFGLNDKEMALYEALLAKGATTIADIAPRAGLKRPTAYLCMDALVARGLAERIKVNAKTYFHASDPAVLEKDLAASRSRLELLKKWYVNNREAVGRRNVQVFEGVERLKDLYMEIAHANSIQSWFSLGESVPFFDAVLHPFAEVLRHNGTNMRDIASDDKYSKKYAEKLRRVFGQTYSYRVLSGGFMDNDTMLFGDRMAIFGLDRGNLYAVRIEDKAVASTFRTLFEVVWKTARPGQKGVSEPVAQEAALR